MSLYDLQTTVKQLAEKDLSGMSIILEHASAVPDGRYFAVIVQAYEVSASNVLGNPFMAHPSEIFLRFFIVNKEMDKFLYFYKAGLYEFHGSRNYSFLL